MIDNAALDAGFEFKQAEVHGMAQRGGAVRSNLRYGDTKIWSDIIPTGKADLVLSVEPLEVMRYRHYLRPGGWVVTSTTPYVNIPDYPEHESLLADLADLENIVMVDTAHFARAAGNLRAQNMVTVGAASPLLDFEEDRLLAFVEMLFARKGARLSPSTNAPSTSAVLQACSSGVLPTPACRDWPPSARSANSTRRPSTRRMQAPGSRLSTTTTPNSKRCSPKKKQWPAIAPKRSRKTLNLNPIFLSRQNARSGGIYPAPTKFSQLVGDNVPPNRFYPTEC